MVEIKSNSVLAMIRLAGHWCQHLGLPRSAGEIFGLLYTSPRPLSHHQILTALGISKGSVSTGTRQLMAWGAIRRTWIPGDRRDYFESVDDLDAIILKAWPQVIRQSMQSYEARLKEMSEIIDRDLREGLLTPLEAQVTTSRTGELIRLQQRFKSIFSEIERLL